MYSAVFARAIRERRVSILVTSLGMFAFAFMFASMHKTFTGDMQMFANSFPPEFSAFVGDLSAAASPEGFLNIELYSLVLPFAVAIMGIILGASVIGKEENSGTLELLLASPVSRSKIILAKFTAIVAALVIISLSAWLGVFVGQTFFVFAIDLKDVLLASLSVLLLGMFYATTALTGHNATGKSALGAGIGATLLALTYFANVISQLIDSLDYLKYVSPFYYMDTLNVLKGEGELINFIILFGASILLYSVAHIKFTKRDTGV